MTIKTIGLLDAIKTPSNPFPGLRPFESNESHLFFGRDEQIGKLLTKFAQTRFLAVVGTSGSGKSSLVRAGLIPALRTGMLPNAKGKWRIAVMRPSNDPMGNLVRALNAPDVFGSAEPENVAIQNAITEATLRLGSRGLIEVAHQNLMTGDENLLVLVDQFEELFRYLREARKAGNLQAENDAADFVKLLLESAKAEANIYVVITMRSDFLGDCSQFWNLPEAINDSQYLVPRFTRDQLREVIEGPVAIGGGQIASRLVNQLLNDIADNQDQLPILQHALMRAWDEWRQPRHHHETSPEAIDLCCYTEIGGMVGALSKHANEAYEALPNKHYRLIAEKMFKVLTEKGEDNREIRRSVEFSKLRAVAEASEDELKTVIETFRQPGCSFLMPPVGTELEGEKKILVDISHESLIRAWTQLQQWANEEAESATIYRRLTDAARRKAEFWRGKDLLEAEGWLTKNNPTESWAERYDSMFSEAMDFLRNSQVKREQERERTEHQQREEADRIQRELETQTIAKAERRRAEEQAKNARNLRWLASLALMLALLAGAAASVAISYYLATENQRANADEQRRKAEVNELEAVKQTFYANGAKEEALAAAKVAAEKQRIAEATQQAFEFQKKLVAEQNVLLQSQQKKLQASLDTSRSLLYVANQLLAWNAFVQNDSNRCQYFLNASFPISGTNNKDDTRSFDWYYLWRQIHDEKQTLKGHTESVWSVACSPDGRMLASGSSDKTLRLWDLSSGREIHKFEGHSGVVNSIAFSPDGLTVASGSSDKTLRLWDVRSGKQMRVFVGSSGTILSLAFSPDGQTLASGSDDRTLRLWSVSNGTQVRKFEGHKSVIRSVAFSPNGQRLASGSWDKTLRLWDVTSGKELRRLEGHTEYVWSVAFSPDGQTLASGSSDKTLRLWDVASGKELRKLEGHTSLVSTVAFSRDGQMLASGSYDKTLRLWDATTGKELRRFIGHLGAINSVEFSPDGHTLVSGSFDQTLRLWDFAIGKEMSKLEEHVSTILSVAFSPDGRMLARASYDKSVKLWDVQSRKELATLQGHRGSVNSVAFSSDGRTLASASDDKSVKLWDVQSHKELATLQGHREPVNSVAFSPDGRTVATASYDKSVKLWDVQSCKELATLQGHGGAVWSVAFSPDGRTLASSSYDKSVKLWDVQSRKELATLQWHGSSVRSVAFSPDGRILASASSDSVKLWDIQSRREFATLQGHSAPVWAVAFSPDGRTLASASYDKLVKLWDIQSGKELVTLQGHGDSVNSVAFSPDGRTLASASSDNSVKLWRGATDEEIARQQNR